MFAELINEFSRDGSTKESRLEVFSKAVSQHEHLKNLIRTHEDVIGKLCESFRLEELPNETIIYTRNSVVKDMYWILEGQIGCWEKKTKEELDYEQRLLAEITSLKESGEEQMWDKRDRMATLTTLLTNIRTDQENDMVRKFDDSHDLFQSPNICFLKRERYLNQGEIIGENCVISGQKYDGLCVVECQKCVVMHLDASVYKTIFRTNIQNFHFIKDALFQVFGFANTKYITRLAYQFDELPYSYNQVVYNEGEVANCVYIIKAGEVELRSTIQEEDHTHGGNAHHGHSQNHNHLPHHNQHNHQDAGHEELINTYKRRFKPKKCFEKQIALCSHGIIGLEDFEDSEDQKKDNLEKNKGANSDLMVGSPDKKKIKFRTLKAISKSNETVLLRIRDKYITRLCKDQGLNHSKMNGLMKQQKANYHKDRLEKLHLFLQKKETPSDDYDEHIRPEKAFHLMVASAANMQAFKEALQEQKKESADHNQMTSSINHFHSGQSPVLNQNDNNSNGNNNNNPQKLLSSLSFIGETQEIPVPRRIFSKARAATYCKTLSTRLQKEEIPSISNLTSTLFGNDNQKPAKGGFLAVLKNSIAQVSGAQEETAVKKRSSLFLHSGSFSQLMTQPSQVDMNSSQGLHSSSSASMSMTMLPKFARLSQKAPQLELLEESANEHQQDDKLQTSNDFQIKNQSENDRNSNNNAEIASKDTANNNNNNNAGNWNDISSNKQNQQNNEVNWLYNLRQSEEISIKSNNGSPLPVSSSSIVFDKIEIQSSFQPAAPENPPIAPSRIRHTSNYQHHEHLTLKPATLPTSTASIPHFIPQNNHNSQSKSIYPSTSSSSSHSSINKPAGSSSSTHLDLLFLLPEKKKRSPITNQKSARCKTDNSQNHLRGSLSPPTKTIDYFNSQQNLDCNQLTSQDGETTRTNKINKQRQLLIQSEYTPQITKKTLQRVNKLHTSKENSMSLQTNQEIDKLKLKQSQFHSSTKSQTGIPAAAVTVTAAPSVVVITNQKTPSQNYFNQNIQFTSNGVSNYSIRGCNSPQPSMRTCHSFNLTKSSNNNTINNNCSSPSLPLLAGSANSTANTPVSLQPQGNIFSQFVPLLNQEPMSITSYAPRKSQLQSDYSEEYSTPKPRQHSMAGVAGAGSTLSQSSISTSLKNKKVLELMRRRNYINPQYSSYNLHNLTALSKDTPNQSQSSGPASCFPLAVTSQSIALSNASELPTFLIKRKQIPIN